MFYVIKKKSENSTDKDGQINQPASRTNADKRTDQHVQTQWKKSCARGFYSVA